MVQSLIFKFRTIDQKYGLEMLLTADLLLLKICVNSVRRKTNGMYNNGKVLLVLAPVLMLILKLLNLTLYQMNSGDLDLKQRLRLRSLKPQQISLMYIMKRG